MSLETTITHAWQTQAKWLYLLTPLSWLYGGIGYTRQLLYKKGIFSSYRANIPVMVIGNITVGGSGKTPLIISLVKHLQSQGIKVGVISRGYGGDTSQMPTLVTLDSTPAVVGDEPCLIVQSTVHESNKSNENQVDMQNNAGQAVPLSLPVPMSVCPNRQQAIELLLKHHPNLQLIISDDGLQHYKLQRDIEWIVVDSHRGFGNEQLLPVGFLREPMSRLQGATVIYHQAFTNTQALPNNLPNQAEVDEELNKLSMQLKPDALQSMQTLLKPSIQQITQTYEDKYPLLAVNFPKKNADVYAVSGIGYPKRFFDTLRHLGYQVTEHPYPDHHDFTLNDLSEIAEKSADKAVIITSKDAVKIKQTILQKFEQMAVYAQSMELLNQLLCRLFILPVSAELSEGCFQEMDKRLKQLNLMTNTFPKN